MPSEPEESTAFSVIFIFPLHLHRPCCCSERRPKTSATWSHAEGARYMSWSKTGLFLLCVGFFFLNHLISEEWVILLLVQTRDNLALLCWQFLFRWAHHQSSSTTCAVTLLARDLTEYHHCQWMSKHSTPASDMGWCWWMTHCYNPSNWGRSGWHMSSENSYGLSKLNTLQYLLNAQFNLDFGNIGFLSMWFNMQLIRNFTKSIIWHGIKEGSSVLSSLHFQCGTGWLPHKVWIKHLTH